MKNKQIFSERRQLKKIAGLLKEDFDYDMGTPSGDTDAMNIAEQDSDLTRVVESLTELSNQVEEIANKFEAEFSDTPYWREYLYPIYSGLRSVSDMKAHYTRSDQKSENVGLVIKNLKEG